MMPIAVIAPNAAIAGSVRAALAAVPGIAGAIHIGMMEDGVRIAAGLIAREHPRVLISRGGTALLLRERLRMNVVDIKISLADAANALIEARKFGRKILFLGFSNHIAGVSGLSEVSGLDIHEKVLMHWQDADAAVAAAKAEGFDAVVGGAIQQEAAKRAGIPFVFLRAGEAAVLAAYREAVAIADAARRDEGRTRLTKYQDGLFATHHFADIVGDSAAIADARRQAEEFARVDATVLVTSESGTGKEMFSQSIHNGGARADGPFVGINCASLSVSILESELFGYADGAFTGARKGGKAGVFEMANNGTIFLDEIGELPLAIQGKLLRIVQERCVMRLGATTIMPVNVRVIAATNLDLVEQVRLGRFRKDLFFRLNVLRLHIPPLRKRREDIPSLAALFLHKYGGEHARALTPGEMALLQAHSWPGNIRELENLMERLSVYPEEERGRVIARHFEDVSPLTAPPTPALPPVPAVPAVLTADTVRAALAANRGSKKKAAEALGVHRSTLYRLMREF